VCEMLKKVVFPVKIFVRYRNHIIFFLYIKKAISDLSTVSCSGKLWFAKHYVFVLERCPLWSEDMLKTLHKIV
jgi:hypothetical protein